MCDLIGIATDLSNAVRQRASEKTGIPVSNIVITATHSHTAPDYMKELYLKLGNDNQQPLRAAYIEKLISGPVEAIVKAHAAAKPVVLEHGSATQTIPVSFNRRSVMRDGSVKTWQSHDNPEVVRAAGPIDPEIALLSIRDQAGKSLGILSNFALHLDTVGGMKWSADNPYFIEQTLRKAAGSDVISIFGTGCCGDINHANPRSKDRNKVDFIGNSIGESIQKQLGQLKRLERTDLVVKSRTIRLPLQDATKEEVAHVMTLGSDVAIVCLPGEVFVELGLAIKQGSPFRTTLVIELSNHVESIYVPHRAAYAGGSYEVTNSNLLPGGGEMLVEAALSLLREAATK